MLHNRLVTELRAHFSTIGPSPQTRPQHGPVAVTLNPVFPDATGPHLVTSSRATLPAVRPSVPRHQTLFPDLLSATAHRCSAFFAEAAVLVLVLGILDRLLSRGHLELRWILCTFLITLALLSASILTDVSARRWLRVQ